MRAVLFSGSPVALCLAAIFVLVTTALTWIEHQTFNSTSLDLAVYAQLLWNGARGHPFDTTLLLHNRLHLAEHLALLLLPLGPLYALVPDPRTLLLIQQTALGLSAAPVFAFARDRLGTRLALLVMSGYLLMPTLAEVALDAFYPIALAALPLGWSILLTMKGRPRSAILLACLAILFEEEAALIAIGLGLLILVTHSGARKLGGVVLILALVWLLIAEWAIAPAYIDPRVGDGETRPESHFSQLRADPLAWLGSVARGRLEPDLPIGPRPAVACSQPGHCSALRWWLYPTGGLALLSPTTLIAAAPPAAALLLADRPGRFRRHWAAPLLPIIWLATAAGLARLARWPRLQSGAAALLAISTLTFYTLDSPLPLGREYEADDIIESARAADLRLLGGQIPRDASLLASRRALAHVANRDRVYVFPPKDYDVHLWPPDAPPEWALLDLTNSDTARDLQSADSYLKPGDRYLEVARTPNAALLRAR